MQTFKDHSNPILKIHRQTNEPKELITADTSGEIKKIDTRTNQSITSYNSFGNGGLKSVGIFNWSSVVVGGSSDQGLKFIDTNDGDVLHSIRYHDGFLGQRLGPICGIVVHPYLPVFLVSSLDSLISVYGNSN